MKLLILLFAAALANGKTSKSLDVIYGNDDRYDLYEVGDPYILTNASSVAMRVQNSSFVEYYSWIKTVRFTNLETLHTSPDFNVCSEEKFSNQPTLGDCSGFLVDRDILATAAHCVTEKSGVIRDSETQVCKETSWMFKFEYRSAAQKLNLNSFPRRDIYSCKNVIFARYDMVNDFALIRLSREVSDARIVRLSDKDQIRRGTKLYSIGHPSGLPKKVTDNAKVLKNEHVLPSFEVNLDSFGSSSGSPVFNSETHEVEGILVRGRGDYQPHHSKNCFITSTCSNSGRRCGRTFQRSEAEEVTKIKYIKDLMLSRR